MERREFLKLSGLATVGVVAPARARADTPIFDDLEVAAAAVNMDTASAAIRARYARAEGPSDIRPALGTALQDLVIGTYNQYSGLTKGIAAHVKANNPNGTLSADAIGKLVQDYKRTRVKSHFRSSPGAHKGIYSRIAREKAMFE